MKNKKIKIVKPIFDRETFINYKRRSKTVCLTTTILFFIFSSFACQPNQAILNSGRSSNDSSNENSTERPKDTYESALRGVQKSGFDYIFVFRRKDGGKFEREDKVYVRENSPAETNQFVLTDEDRVVIAGSNYPFPEDSLEILRKVFNVEDLSPKKAEETNDNSNKKITTNSNPTNGNLNNKSETNSNKASGNSNK